MKKVIIALVTAIAVGCMAMVQPAKAGGVYDGVAPAPGSSILGVKLGLSHIVGANVTYDYALARVWKGTFTIGGRVGYMWRGNTDRYTYGGVTEKYSWSENFLDFQVRTTYRLNVVVPQWEVYAGVALGGGVDIASSTAKVSGEGSSSHAHGSGSRGYFSGAFILGTSYNFTDAIGANLEFDLGAWEQAWVNLGVNFKF